MELEAELDRLYGLPLGEFVAGRNALAKRLRQAGDREAGDRVKALAKPSLTAWAVNQLYFRAPQELAALAAAGEALRAAHLAGGEAHRAATGERRAVISRLLELAGELFAELGQPFSRSHRQRISRTLEALASQGDAPGRLSRDLEPTGFDALSGLAGALGTIPRLRLVKPEEPSPEPRAAVEKEPAAGIAETLDFTAERQRRRDQARRQRRRDVERLDRQLAAARETAEELTARVADLERRAAAAAGERALAETSSSSAAEAARLAEHRAREAREAAARARREAEAAAAAAKHAADELGLAREEVERLEAERRRRED